MNYYRRYVGDYLRDTSRLSMLEHGAYNLLLDYYYAEERPIPPEMDDVYRMVRAIMPEERRAVQKVLSTYFVKKDDGWHNKRADDEIEKGINAIEQMADAGKRGAEKRWGSRRGTDAGADGVGHDDPKEKDRAPHRVTDAGGDASTNPQPPSSSLQPPPTKKKKALKRPIPDDFVVSERVEKWALGKGFTSLERYCEFFVGRMKASGREYADWDQAFMNCVSEDWPNFRAAGNVTPDYSRLVHEPH